MKLEEHHTLLHLRFGYSKIQLQICLEYPIQQNLLLDKHQLNLILDFVPKKSKKSSSISLINNSAPFSFEINELVFV